jgi:hypothetical protein
MAKPKDTPKKSSENKLPTGKEVMKRRTPTGLKLRPARFESDPKKAYTAEQLAEIGAITLKWNQIEGSINFIGAYILFAKTPIWLQVATDRALSSNTKLSLLKECLKRATLLDEKAKGCAYDCFAEVEQCRAYRNAIIHHHIYDHEKGIGSYVDESRSPYQILVSIEALQALYGILCALLDELHEIDLLFRMETDAQRPGRFNEKMQFQPFSKEKLRESIIPDHTKRILALQKSRKELQKLPKFPDADLIRSMTQQDEGE